MDYDYGGYMVNKILNEQQLKAVCDVVAETDKGIHKEGINRIT